MGGAAKCELRNQWLQRADELSRAAWHAYHELIEHPGFMAFFEQATPIAEIENLPIGSRPARRQADRTLENLRAIPWVFSWTQSRCMLPAWYGLGTAIEHVIKDRPTALDELREMYQNWAFFGAAVDNAELALAKADMCIAAHYASLATDQQSAQRIQRKIEQEYALSCTNVLAICQLSSLLERTAWLQRSIELRNRAVDPLNFVQVELLRRLRCGDLRPEEAEEYRQLARLSIQSIAAGLRTAG